MRQHLRFAVRQQTTQNTGLNIRTLTQTNLQTAGGSFGTTSVVYRLRNPSHPACSSFSGTKPSLGEKSNGTIGINLSVRCPSLHPTDVNGNSHASMNQFISIYRLSLSQAFSRWSKNTTHYLQGGSRHQLFS